MVVASTDFVSAKSESDSIEPKFNEFIILFVVGADLPKTEALPNIDDDVTVSVAVLGRTVNVVETGVPSRAVVLLLIVVVARLPKDGRTL